MMTSPSSRLASAAARIFPSHLLAGDELLALDVAAPLGIHLVLEMDGRDPRRLELPHRAHDVDRVPVPGIRIGDDGDRHRLGEVVGHHRHLPHGEEADVGLAEEGVGDPGTGHVDGGEARFLDQPRGERIPGARHRGQLPRIQHGLERPALRSRVIHLVPPPGRTGHRCPGSWEILGHESPAGEALPIRPPAERLALVSGTGPRPHRQPPDRGSGMVGPSFAGQAP